MQTTNTVFLVRPASFSYNTQTATSNAFQTIVELSPAEVQAKALEEFDGFVLKLRSEGIQVQVFEDSITPVKPDAIFPNNWISIHADGTIVLYPMCTPNRRLERNQAVLDWVEQKKDFNTIIDYTVYEDQERFLEGTGSIIFDHLNKKAYACLSPRTDQGLFENLMVHLGYQAIYFNASDKNGLAIYHSNVMMSIGTGFSVICLESIKATAERKKVVKELEASGLDVVAISLEQVEHFAGNMLALHTEDGQILVLSKRAFDCLTTEQKQHLEQYAKLLPMDIPTIELIGGGSARCMLAEVF
jgi:hypothetical protein